jgi:hypothetical protein
LTPQNYQAAPWVGKKEYAASLLSVRLMSSLQYTNSSAKKQEAFDE